MQYKKSHPWITFSAEHLQRIPPSAWMTLGEAKVMCEQLAGTPLRPEVAEDLYKVALVKGVHATAAIEGNTLTEEEIEGIRNGSYTVPPSRAYQEQEVRNIISALNLIGDELRSDHYPRITPELMCDYNFQVLNGTEHEAGAIPGHLRTHSVGVPGYVGAPAEDCDYLLHRLAEWLEGDEFSSNDPTIAFALNIARAICAHLYIAWIHPFGDGNGRTARLIEFALLARTGVVPFTAAHLLTNHYNLTRVRYQRELAKSSRIESIAEFVVYATQGLVDGLRIHTLEVRKLQMKVAWENYVYTTMDQFPPRPPRRRQRALALALPSETVVHQSAIPDLNPELARLYAVVGSKTLSRDLNVLAKVQLVQRVGRGRWMSNDKSIRAFLPPTAAGTTTA